MTTNMNPLKITWRDKLRNWIGMFFYKRLGVKAGPFMFHSRGEWWFIDHIGNIWIIRYTGRVENCPLQITLFHKI